MSASTVESLVAMSLAAVLCALVLWVLLRTGLAGRLALDVPNARSLHRKPVPRCGGLGLLAPTFIVLFGTGPAYWSLGVACAALATISLIDDRLGLSAALRLIAQAAITGVLLWIGFPPYPLWLLPIAFLYLIWMSNLYNFMDGANGMAGSMTAIGFAFYAYAASSRVQELAVICSVISGGAIGFLPFNAPRARVFLGDVGAIPIGFLAGSLGLFGHAAGVWPLWFPVVVFLPFVADATVTLLKRARRREPVWLAHREHYYQRMVRMGWSHTSTSMLWASIMLLSGIVSISLLTLESWKQLAGILGWALILLLMGLLLDRRWKLALTTRS